MCCGCWEKDGAPRIWNERVQAIVELLPDADHYGALHIVVDDNNVTDEDLDWCRREGARPKVPWTDHDERIYRAMKAASYAERVSAMGIDDGCWSPDDR